MSIFGRKEIAELKAELDKQNKELVEKDICLQDFKAKVAELKQKYNQCLTDLTESNKAVKVYKRKYYELSSIYDIPSVSSASSATNEELAKLKEKCNVYKIKLDNANREIENYKHNLLAVKARSAEIDKQYEERLNSEINDIDNLENDDDDKVYYIRNIVKKNSYYIDKVYCSKSDLFHSSRVNTKSHEYEMYKLLLNIIYELKSEALINTEKERENVRLSLFAQVRLADIVGLQSSTFDKFKNAPYRKNICKMIEDKKPDFDNDDYKRTFLYPILSSHIDFLVCLNGKTLCEPFLAIELHGKEHDEKSDKADKKRIWYDEFKKALFESKKVNIKLIVAQNYELENEERKNKLKNNIREILIACLEKREDVLHI